MTKTVDKLKIICYNNYRKQTYYNRKKKNMTNEMNENLDVIKCPSTRAETLSRQELSLGEQLAVEQYVSFNFERTLHKRNYQNYNTASTNIFSAYVTIVQANPKILGNIVDYMVDEKFTTAEDVETILFWMSMGMVPYDIWVNKVIEDLKEPSWYYQNTSITGLLTVYLARVLRCSLVGFNKLVKAIKEEFPENSTLMRAVSFAEARYLEVPRDIKDGYNNLIKTDNKELSNRYYNNEISLFSECLIDMMKYPMLLNVLTEMRETGNDLGIFQIYWYDPYALKEQAEARSAKFPTKEPLKTDNNNDFSGINMVGIGPNGASEASEVAPVPESSIAYNEQTQQRPGMGVFPIDLLGWSAIGESPSERTPKDKNVKEEPHVTNIKPQIGWMVLKVAKDSSSRIMSRKRFTTREEAVQFRDDVLKDSPELGDKFDFKIEPIYAE